MSSSGGDSLGSVLWVLEPGVFASGDDEMERAVKAAGHEIIHWNDDWWQSGQWPVVADDPVVFQGSLANAHRVRAELPWRPGSYCDTSAFLCSTWYSHVADWLLHEEWVLTHADALADNPRAVLGSLASASHVFIRPDSPLKPFSGRVLPVDGITLDALDHGFYYDDKTIAVVAAPVRDVGREWRYVVADGRVVAGSAYDAASRSASPDDPNGGAWTFAQEVVAGLTPPERVYVLDVCEVDDRLRLLELNPFSGADLYACDRTAVLAAVARAATGALDERL